MGCFINNKKVNKYFSIKTRMDLRNILALNTVDPNILTIKVHNGIKQFKKKVGCDKMQS